MKKKKKPGPRPTLARLVAAKLAASGITSEDARRLGLRSISQSEIGRLPNAPDLPHNDGLRIPYFNLKGEPLFVPDRETDANVLMWRVRYLPALSRNGFAVAAGASSRAKEIRYIQPKNVGCPLFLAPLVDWAAEAADPKRELWITEGELKAAAGTKAGQPTIGLGGVWNFKGKKDDRPLCEQFYEFQFEERRVVIASDSDWATNADVRYGRDRLARELANLGAVMLTLNLPSLSGLVKVGLDDYLQNAATTPKKALQQLRDLVVPWRDMTMNDSGNAACFVSLHGARYFFCRQEKQWRANEDGKLWKPAHTAEAFARTQDVSAQLQHEASTLTDEETQKQAYRWALQSGNEGRRSAILKLAAAELVRDVDCLDADPELLNLQNGTLRLQDFRLLPHDPQLFQGRISPVSYDPAARCPEFEKFLSRIMPSAPIREFLRRVAGYALTGLTREHCFFIFYGLGRNGKSTLVETLFYVLGDYAWAANADTFLAGRRAGTVRDDLYALRGARLVKATETGQGASLDEPTIKEHTGGDTVNSRPLYGTQTNWRPVYKLILISNEKPKVEGTDDGIWSRLRFVPFEVTIPENERIADYFANRLKSEAAGILNWALAGLRQYWQRGLEPPPEVRAATQEYRADENVVQHFLDAKCYVDRKAIESRDGPDRWLHPDGLKALFTEWRREQGYGYRYRDTNLKDRLEQLRYRQVRGHKGRYWLGIRKKMLSDDYDQKYLKAANLKHT
jgi:P4 family phage/plasmid primase-like protien